MLRFAIPAGFLALLVLLGVGLSLDPREVPSPLIGKPVPAFDVERLRYPQARLRDADLKGQVSLVNFWATWCEGCRDEHPLLVHIAEREGVPIYGINYKDAREPALRWLDLLGDPYAASGYDTDGRVGLDLGVYGLPETFVVGPDGVIAHRHVGPLTESDWRHTLAPLIRSLRGG